MLLFAFLSLQLALVYTVFWYLYQRYPKTKERINASMWGLYEETVRNGAEAVPLKDLCYCLQADGRHRLSTLHSDEFVLDKRNNRYACIPDSGYTIAELVTAVDRTCSQLNVRP